MKRCYSSLAGYGPCQATYRNHHNHNCRQEKTPDRSKPNQGRVEPEDGRRRKFVETLCNFVHSISFYVILTIHLLGWDMPPKRLKKMSLLLGLMSLTDCLL